MSAELARVLLVDDEASVLDGLRRRHRKHFELVGACGPEAGLKALAEGEPFAVVVSDFRMPSMNGAAFLAEVRRLHPQTTRILLTGQAELSAATEAVNRGHIFRFLSKPCDPELFQEAVRAGVEQYELVRAEKVLLERTLKGCIEVLVDVLGLANPNVFGRATRVRHYVAHVVGKLGLENAWRYETAALLSQIGCIAVPNDVFERQGRGEELPAVQSKMIERHPSVARDLLHKIPRLDVVAEIVGRQRGRDPGGETSDEVLQGSRILAAALEYDRLLSLGVPAPDALRTLGRDVALYGEEVLAALGSAEALAAQARVLLLPLDRLEPGMVLDEDVRNANDALIVPRGHLLTPSSLSRLANYAELGMLSRAELLVRRRSQVEAGAAA